MTRCYGVSYFTFKSPARREWRDAAIFLVLHVHKSCCCAHSRTLVRVCIFLRWASLLFSCNSAFLLALDLVFGVRPARFQPSHLVSMRDSTAPGRHARLGVDVYAAGGQGVA